MVRLHVGKDILEDDLGHQHLVGGGELASHPALELHNAVLVDELESPQHPPHAAQVVGHHHELALADLFLQLLHLRLHLDLPLEGRHVRRDLGVPVQRALRELPVQVGDAGEGGVEVLPRDVHVGDRVQLREAGGLEALVVLDRGQRLEQRAPHLVGLRVAVRHVRPDVADLPHQLQGHGQDLALGLGPRGRHRPLLLHGARLARDEDVEDPLRVRALALGVLRLRRDIAAARGDEDCPPPIDVPVLHVHQAARVEEPRDVVGRNDDLPQVLLLSVPLLREVVVVGDGLVQVELVLCDILHRSSQVLHLRQLHLDVPLLILNCESVAIFLELVETALDHVVRVRTFEPQQVDEHVVA
mmetsp:Transcript_126762/g.354968  ORF Transcript_126762/g.354968 Transcript_126762/m.354968 type:complete len:357 (+) Transcript_126762:455-1525(+)